METKVLTLLKENMIKIAKMNKVLFLTFVISSHVYSQSQNENSSDVKGPNVADFIKYGDISSISNVGEMQLTIPIFSLPIAGQNVLDISINYVGSGFRPAKRSGLIGYNWFLNVGGVINRIVNNVPDDQKGHATTWIDDTNYANGFIIGVTNKTHNPLDVFNFASSTGYTGSWSKAKFLYGNNIQNQNDVNNYEPDPDTFSFNFNGLTGNFFMGNDGIIKVITSSPNILKIDLSQMSFQDDFNAIGCKPQQSAIIITDNLGNKYYFGGELKNLEYSLSGSVAGGKFISNKQPIINSWFLSKIEYYKGSVVNFNYRDDSLLLAAFANQNVAEHGAFGRDSNRLSPEYALRDFVVLNEFYSQDNSYCTNSNVTIPVGPNIPTYSVQKIAILDNVIGEDFKVIFEYSRQPHAFNNRNTITDFIPTNVSSCLYNRFLDIKLDKISLFDFNNNLIKNFDLLHDHFGGTLNSRMFLKSLTEFGKPPHLFSYFPTGNLPKPITYGIDHWGYWNGKNDNNNRLIPFVDYNWSTGDYLFQNNLDGTSRNSNFDFALKGQLKKVVFPTGGFSEFEYEPHDYSKRLETRSNNGFTPALYNVTGIAGGTRIKKITDFDGINFSNIKEYKYSGNFENSGLISSGILFKWPRYHSYYSADSRLGYQYYYLWRSSNPIGNIIENTPVIGYSEVTEILNGNGYKISKFSDYVSNPDLLDYQMQLNIFPGICSPMGLAINYGGNLLNTRSNERGKIVSEQIYDNNLSLKMSTAFTYNINPNKFNDFSTRIHISGPVTITNKIYHFSDYLAEKRITKHLPTGNILTYEMFYYKSTPNYFPFISNQDVLNKQSFLSSVNNNLIETEFKYPWEIYAVGSADYNNFKSANIYSPLKETQFKNNFKVFEKFSSLEKNYSTNNKLKLKNLYTSKFPNSNSNLGNVVGQLEKKITYDQYDNKGNILQYTPENGMKVCMIWGYNQTLPIAKLENIDYSSVAPYIANLQTTFNTANNEANLIIALNNLRTAFPNAMITTYTHKPLIGVSTITDPKGDTVKYFYDAFNRLEYVLDKNGNRLSENQYNYKP